MSAFDPLSIRLSRRDFVIGGAAFATTLQVRSRVQRCTLSPEQEEGPYYIDGAMLRRDIRKGKPGTPLQLRIAVVDAGRCTPLERAAVDIWHCDAGGVYSGFTANGGGPENKSNPSLGPRGQRGRGGPLLFGQQGRGQAGSRGSERLTDETRFLRGVQITDNLGVAEFQTIYPGWYAGRTIHVHVKVRVEGSALGYSDRHVAHTGQLFFPETITEEIAALDPYIGHAKVHRTLHSEDDIFRSQGGAQSMLTLERLKKGTNADGFIADITLAVNSADFSPPNNNPTYLRFALPLRGTN